MKKSKRCCTTRILQSSFIAGNKMQVRVGRPHFCAFPNFKFSSCITCSNVMCPLRNWFQGFHALHKIGSFFPFRYQNVSRINRVYYLSIIMRLTARPLEGPCLGIAGHAQQISRVLPIPFGSFRTLHFRISVIFDFE